MTALLRFLARSGVVVCNPFHATVAYRRMRVGDAMGDWLRLEGDMRAVGEDLRRTTIREIKQNGKQAYKRPGEIARHGSDCFADYN